MKTKNLVLSGLLAGFAIFVIGQLVNILVSATMAFDMLALAGMRSVADPVMMLFFLHPFVLAFAMAFAYSKIQPAFKGSWKSKALQFGSMVWLVAGLPSAFLVYTSMDYPLAFTISSVIGSILYMLAASLIIAKFEESN